MTWETLPGNVPCLILHGRQGRYAERFLSRAIRRIPVRRPRWIVLDLSESPLLPDVHLDLLLAAANTMALHRGRILILNPSASLWESLAIRGAASLFSYAENIDEAMALVVT